MTTNYETMMQSFTYSKTCSCGAVMRSQAPFTPESRCHTCREGAAPTAQQTPTENPYASIACEIACLVAEKQKAYGDSAARSEKILEILYPDGIPTTAYPDALLIVRVLDKISRIATDRDALGESPWADLVGYGLLALNRRKAT